ARLSDQQRELVKCGVLSLSRLHHGVVSDEYLDRLVIKHGAGRMLAAIDRYTRPQFTPAAGGIQRSTRRPPEVGARFLYSDRRSDDDDTLSLGRELRRPPHRKGTRRQIRRLRGEQQQRLEDAVAAPQRLQLHRAWARRHTGGGEGPVPALRQS